MLPEIIFKDITTGAAVLSFGQDRVALRVPGVWHSRYIELYKKYRCTFVWIQAHDGSSTLEKLIEERLSDELQLMGSFSNLQLVAEAKFLKSLTLQLTTRPTLDLSDLQLESLHTSTKHITPGSHLPKSLRHLTLSEYNGVDLRPLEYLKGLNYLELGPARKLASLEGLFSLPELTVFAVWYASHLSNINQLQLCKTLQVLKFNQCKAINSIEALNELRDLKTVHLNNCGAIESLSPIGHLNNVEEILFVEDTIIEDGAIRQLANLPSLGKVWFKNRRHYDITREDLARLLGAGSKS